MRHNFAHNKNGAIFRRNPGHAKGDCSQVSIAGLMYILYRVGKARVIIKKVQSLEKEIRHVLCRQEK